jgi:hypothetical protein
MSKSTLTISIGRNVPNKSVAKVNATSTDDVAWNEYRGSWYLGERDWLDFQIGVETIFRDGMANTRAEGTSVWDGDVEETCIFQWFDAPRPTEDELAQLRKLADEYGQDAIAVTYATPKFI